MSADNESFSELFLAYLKMIDPLILCILETLAY